MKDFAQLIEKYVRARVKLDGKTSDTTEAPVKGREEALENANRFRDGIWEVREPVVEAARRQLARQKEVMK